MISIIICSRSSSISPELKQNIENTIGVAFELIIIDNSNNNHSIFSAYNEGVRKSNFEVLCFMHDDIVFNTNNWGQSVYKRFESKNIGAIGVAGSPYYSILPGAWWSGGYICQHLSGHQNISYTTLENNALPVVVLDGLWFCIRKSLFESIRFDDLIFSGFHYYDIDICLQVHHQGYDLLSVYDISIKHSSGKLDTSWLQNGLLLQEKWKKILPISTKKLSYFKEVTIEYAVLEEYIKSMKNNGYKFFNILSFVIRQTATFRIKRFKISFPLIFIYLSVRYLLKKLHLR
jgi:GT2 family glycosyltransferase